MAEKAMKKIPQAKPTATLDANPEPKQSPLWNELREVLLPERKWHYAFHVAVIVVAVAYWVGSLMRWPGASWGEIAMYRPHGDNQVFPIIAALSKLNFGDPTDAAAYGQGLGGFQVVILLPYAVGYALFGGAGYMLMDLLLTFAYFVVAALFLRRSCLGKLTSLVLASALATGSLQTLSAKISTVVEKLFFAFGCFSGEWRMPPLFNLDLYSKRIPRPMVTEIFLLIVFCLLVQVWRERRLPSFKWGLGVGAALSIVLQGDPYSFSAAGLLLAGVLGVCMAANKWKFPWRCALGGITGALLCGWFFIIQLLNQTTEASVRFGMIDYGRSKIWLLPGYGHAIRVVVASLLVAVVVSACRHRRHAEQSHQQHNSTEPNPLSSPVNIAYFCWLMLVAAWLAQPVQILLLGKSVQTFHYLLYTLPTFYGYAVLILLAHLAHLAFPNLLEPLAHFFRQPLHRPAGFLVGLAFFLQIALGLEESVEAIMNPTTSRAESSPWQPLGERYRDGFRAMDQEFRTNPTLRQARSFATFCHEVNFLLAGFHDKRAFLPDNAYSTLSDRELEERLCIMGKLCGMPTDAFAQFVQNEIIMNFWLGCAKYWFEPGHTYSSLNDYLPGQVEVLKKIPEGKPFNLALPYSAVNRVVTTYRALPEQPPGPDLIIMTPIIKDLGYYPRPPYELVYTNDVFFVYAKPSAANVSQSP
jgi:hypothetical protein